MSGQDLKASSSSAGEAGAASVLALAARAPGFEGRRAHRPGGARIGLKRLGDAAARRGADALARALETAEGQTFFAFLFGNSPHLSGLLLRDLEFAEALATQGPEAIAGQIRGDLAGADPAMEQDALMRFLRVRRSRVAVAAAVFDCFDIWGVMQCAELLSDMADHAVRLAVAHLLLKSAARRDLQRPEGGRWGYFALAMGKHGSRELNYSSDIDLIVLYEPERCGYLGAKTHREHFSRLTRELVTILESRTADGYVFRTDLRLRPDASSTPPAVTAGFALDYYNRVGRTWERAAMIKARPVAGDLQAGAEFLERLSPFIWDEALDFRSVEEIRSMSEQIHDFHGHGDIQLPGWNLKLGRGGIREIEFFVHMHQLAHGGRNRRLRGAQVLPMLATLEREHHILPKEAETLAQAYLLLRRAEHRLQMVNDSQTQTMPESDEGLDGMAAFLNFPSRQALGARLGELAAEVHRLYLARFNVPEREQDIGEAILTGPEGHPEALERLRAAGFEQAQTAFDTFRGWAEGRHASTAPLPVQAVVRALLHDVVEALAELPDPDRALARLDGFLADLPEDIAFFSMLRANAWLLNLIAVVMGAAPSMADRLSANPRLLQAALDPSFFLPIPDKNALAAELAEHLAPEPDFRRRADRLARWAGDRLFQVDVQTIQHLVDLDEACASRSHVAEAAVETLLADAMADLERRRGPAPAEGWAVLALGDLGADNLIFGSRLELVFLADGPEAISRFHARAAWRLAAALNRRAAGGRPHSAKLSLGALPTFWAGLHPQDRPLADDGGEGCEPIQRLMALTRARVLCGTPAAAQEAASALRRVLTVPREPEPLRKALVELRERASQARPEEPFALRHARGGLLDLECIARHLQLAHASEAPEILAGGVAAAFEAQAAAGLLPAEEARFLAGAFRRQRAIQAFLRLVWSEDIPASQAPDALQARLASAFDQDGFPALEAQLRQTQQRAFECYQRRLLASP